MDARLTSSMVEQLTLNQWVQGSKSLVKSIFHPHIQRYRTKLDAT